MKLSGSWYLGFQHSPRAGCRQEDEVKNGLEVVQKVEEELLVTCGVEAGWYLS